MKKYFDFNHLFFCIYMVFALVLGLLLAKYDPVMAYGNATICVLTIVLSNQVICAFNRANFDYRIPNGLPPLDVPGQNIARYLMLAAAAAQYHFPWSFDLRGFLNGPNLLVSIFVIYFAVSSHQIWSLNRPESSRY